MFQGISGRMVNAEVEELKDYIFKMMRLMVFENLGYGKENPEYLITIYKEQAIAKYNAGDFTIGKLDHYSQHGQRINIEIELHGIGEYSGKISYNC